MSYNKLQEYVNSQEDEKIIQYLNTITFKELKDFIGSLQKFLYTNYSFFSYIKKVILNYFDNLSERNKHIFNFLFCINKDNLSNNFKFIISNSNIEIRMLDILLSGVIRNHSDLLKSLINTNLVLSKHHKIALAKFFIARGESPKTAFQLLNIDHNIFCNRNKKDKLKVALLVSGQTRGIETALASWATFFDFIDSDVDVFISTWKNAGRPKHLDINRLGSDKAYKIIQSSNKEDKDILKNLEVYLPPYELSEEYFLEIFHKYIPINSIDIEIEHEEKYPFYSNSMKLYYKINRAFEMSRKKGIYDLYIRIRPDIILSGSRVNLKELESEARVNNVIYSHYSYVYEYYGFGVDDKIAIAKHDLMEIYSNTWFGDKNEMIGHTTLAQNLIENNISVRTIPDLKIKFTNYNIINDDFLKDN